jgi:hypothetical protein
MITNTTSAMRGTQSEVSNESAVERLTAAPSSRKRDKTQNKEQRIAKALRIVAALLEKDEAYLPIFLRLEAELEALEKRKAALSRARTYIDMNP